MTQEPDQTKPDEELFEIELAKVVRDFDPAFGIENYDVTFECHRLSQSVEATVEIDAETVTTLEIVPRAMSEVHKMFAALADQTKAWLVESK